MPYSDKEFQTTNVNYINKTTIMHKLTSTATNLCTFKLTVWKSIIGSISILINNANTNGTIIGWVKYKIKATAITANINNDPVIILLLSNDWFIYFFSGLKISGLSLGKDSI